MENMAGAKASSKPEEFSFKRVLVKGTMLIPLWFIYYLFRSPVTIYLERIDFYLDYWKTPAVFMAFTVFWLVFPPFGIGRSCRGTWLYEILYNLTPVMLFLFVVFIEHHVWLSALLVSIFVALQTAFNKVLRRNMRRRDDTRKKERIIKKAKNRFFVMSVVSITLIPGIIATAVYNLKDPYYQAQEELWNWILESADATDETAEPESPYANYSEELLCLNVDNWS